MAPYRHSLDASAKLSDPPWPFQGGSESFGRRVSPHRVAVSSHERSKSSVLPSHQPLPCAGPPAMKYTVTVHPNGLSPVGSAKAWHLRTEGEKPWSEIKQKAKTVVGKRPGQRALENAVKRQSLLASTELFPNAEVCNMLLLLLASFLWTYAPLPLVFASRFVDPV